jgi:hypothetical protein
VAEAAAQAASSPPKLYERPAVAFLGATLLLVLAGAVYPNIAPFPTHAKHIYISIVVFMAAQLVAVLVYRRYGRVAGEWFGVVGALALYLFACGPAYTGCLLGLVLVTHYVLAPRVPYPVSMLILFVALLAMSFHVPLSPLFGVPWGRGLRWIAFYGGFRLIYYTFDYAAIPRSKRSIRIGLGYSVFSLVLLVGAAPSYYMSTSRHVPQPELDRLGSIQLLRGGFKMVGASLGRLAFALWLPDLHGYDNLPIYFKIAAVATLMLVWAFRMAGPWDYASGIGNLCGYHMTDTYTNPLGAVSPIGTWRRMNTPLIEYYMRCFVMPIVRHIRSSHRMRQLVMYVVVAIAVTVWHVLLFEFVSAQKMEVRLDVATVVAIISGALSSIVFMPAVWYIGDGMEWLAKRNRALFVAMWIINQTYFAFFMFPHELSSGSNFASTKKLTPDEAACMARRTFTPSYQCPELKPEASKRPGEPLPIKPGTTPRMETVPPRATPTETPAAQPSQPSGH